MKSEPDYYTILQVDPRAEPEVIQAAPIVAWQLSTTLTLTHRLRPWKE